MLAAVCCFFNPMKYRRPVENWHRFRTALRDDLPLYSVELSFDGEFQTESTWKIRGNLQDHLMWQKERLLNLAAEKVPAEYDKIAWLDTDVLFLNEGWVEEAEELLDEKPVVQLFDSVVMLDETHGPIGRGRGIGAAVADGLQPSRSHPGFAWAARREVLPLLDDHILGLADAAMAYAWLGRCNNWLSARMNPDWREEYLNWALPQYERVRGNLGYVSGDVLHLWHGTRTNRRYRAGWSYLTSQGYQPSTDIRVDSNGLWTWTGAKQQMQRLVRRYFRERKEDES